MASKQDKSLMKKAKQQSKEPPKLPGKKPTIVIAIDLKPKKKSK